MPLAVGGGASYACGMMRPSFAAWMAVASLAAADEPLLQADFSKLRDRATGAAEAARLSGCDGKEEILTGYKLLRCPQGDGAPDLFALLAGRRYDFASRSTSPSEYASEGLEELFSEKAGEADPVAATFEPSMAPVTDAHLLVFDAEGAELRPFGGNNYINPGHVFDFNGDGILERADSTNYGIKEAPDSSVEAFELVTFEREPRTLLEVIFNWHPRRADDANEWTFSCFDEEGDGLIEIGFGPEDATSDADARRFVFRWDREKQKYVCGEIPEKAHIRIVQPGESYAEIAKAGGLGYPVIEEDAGEGKGTAEPGPGSAHPGKPYVHRSLKGASNGELAAFFSGRPRRGHFDDPEDAVANHLPEGFWEMEPKSAALALAEVNRRPDHRQRWKLAIDDRDGLGPPESGWVVHDWGSSGCYSYSSHQIALHFGVPEPVLVVLEYNSIGVVGRNPWADQPAHAARLIRLEPGEARFLADTLFWLDRVRAWAPRGADDDHSFRSSTADGRATLDFHPSGGAPRRLAAETVWATSSISGSWEGAFDRVIFINLAEYLLGDALPKRLGDRWDAAPAIDRQSLTTSTRERLEGRSDAAARRELADSLLAILGLDEKPPPTVLRALVAAAGDEALTSLLPGIEQLGRSLPSRDAEDDEFEALDERFARDHFGNPLADEPAEHREAWERLGELREKRRFRASAVLREPIDRAIERLRLASDETALMETIVAEGADSRWALLQLRRLDVDDWAGVLEFRFDDQDLAGRRSVFATLAAGHPATAGRLAASLVDRERRDLIIEICRFHREHDAGALGGNVPVLMELVRDREADFIRRGEAMVLLSGIELPDPTLEEFTRLLLAEVGDPQEGSYGMNTRGDALAALAKIPGARNHLEVFTSLDSPSYSEFAILTRALHELTRDEPKREELLAGAIRQRLKSSDGMMNDVLLTCLALDLRDLTPELGELASEGPDVADGDGANYAGGSFTGPEGERYHLAREITGLWSEPGAETRARLWVFLACAHPHRFDPGQGDAPVWEALRLRAAEAIVALDEGDRQRVIDSALRHFPTPGHFDGFAAWLRSLE